MDPQCSTAVDTRGHKQCTPNWAMTLPVQRPLPGPINIYSIAWTIVHDNRLYHNVAAIPESRLVDFLNGEAVRGETSFVRKCPGRGKLRKDEMYICMYGPNVKRAQQHRCNNQQAWEAVLSSSKTDRIAQSRQVLQKVFQVCSPIIKVWQPWYASMEEN